MIFLTCIFTLQEISKIKAIQIGLREMKNEVRKWREEVSTSLSQDPLLVFPGLLVASLCLFVYNLFYLKY